jgi:hypothetical protein
LHRVGDGQQHDQVERVHLRQLALAREPKPDDEEHVHQDRAQDLFDDRRLQGEHGLQQ